MKMIIALFALVAVAAAAPAVPTNEVTVVKSYPNTNNGFENYQFGFELSDGQKKEETGELVQVPGAETASYRVRGSYSFVDPTGQVYTVTYVADENGFQPSGQHLPA